jgi:thiosulfate/3-mercaptopyruvate sulfurtransferase
MSTTTERVSTTASDKGYVNADVLVTTEWVAQHLNDPKVRILESDEDVLLYDLGHIPGAQKIDWHTDLNDPVVRDYVSKEQFQALLRRLGIDDSTTVVFYGDKSNWWAAYALWVFTLFGHEDVRLVNGGRAKWIDEGRDLTKEVPTRAATSYPVIERDDAQIRAYQSTVLQTLGQHPLIDVRSTPEYTGERTHMAEYPQEGVLRGGHVPGAKSVPWGRAANPDGTFKSRQDLEKIYFGEAGLTADSDVIAYCRIGERSSHTWFVLTHLLGLPHVRNYDGSWTEWGNSVRVPVAQGLEPGAAPGSAPVAG